MALTRAEIVVSFRYFSVIFLFLHVFSCQICLQITGHKSCKSQRTCEKVEETNIVKKKVRNSTRGKGGAEDVNRATEKVAQVPNLIGDIQGVFFNWPPLQTGPPQKCFDWPPPKLSKCWNHIHFARHLGVFRSEGGPVWDSNVFLKSVTYRPTLSKFRGGPVKRNTLYFTPKNWCAYI